MAFQAITHDVTGNSRLLNNLLITEKAYSGITFLSALSYFISTAQLDDVEQQTYRIDKPLNFNSRKISYSRIRILSLSTDIAGQTPTILSLESGRVDRKRNIRHSIPQLRRKRTGPLNDLVVLALNHRKFTLSSEKNHSGAIRQLSFVKDSSTFIKNLHYYFNREAAFFTLYPLAQCTVRLL